MKQFIKFTLILSAFLLPMLAQALPFVPTSSPSAKPIHWYHLKTSNLYVYASPDPYGDSDIKVSSSASNSDEYLWCFVGDATSGYKIYNRGTKSYLYAGQFLGPDTESSLDYYEAGSGNNFYIYALLTVFGSTQTLKNYLCYQSGEGFYTTRGRDSYFTVTEALFEEEPQMTADTLIGFVTYDEKCELTVYGKGDLHLYVNGTEVENPYQIARTNADQTLNVTATAQEEGKLMSTVTATLTVPRLENPIPDPPADVTLTPYDYYIPNNELGNEDGEGYAKMFDKDKNTKWCVVNSSGAWQTIWVDFKSNRPITPKGYILTPGNDTYYYTGRNPKAWKLYGKAKENDGWAILAVVTDGAAAGLGTRNSEDYHFPIEGNTTAYQYFRFEVSEICGKDGWNPSNYVFQMAEFAFEAASTKGDVNGDGLVDIDDLNIVINIMLRKATVSQWPNADVDANGEVDIDDLNAVINIMVGKG